MVMTPSFTHLSITFSNQRFSGTTVDVGFVKLMSDSFCGDRVFKVNIQPCYSSSVLRYVWFFETILLIVRRFLSVNVDFLTLFLFTDIVLPWFVYSDITLTIFALDTPNNVAGFVIEAPATRALTISLLSKSEKSPILRFFHMDSHST
jgi:hypothetical protein